MPRNVLALSIVRMCTSRVDLEMEQLENSLLIGGK